MKSELERRLHPSIIKFLKNAGNDLPGTGATAYSFYYIGSLSDPADLLYNLDGKSLGMDISEEPDRYIELYVAKHWEGRLL
jgi:hypothetical protein